MIQNHSFADASRLTAYALGELDAGEAALVEAAILHDPVAQDTVAQIRSIAVELEEALKNEPIMPRYSRSTVESVVPRTRGQLIRYTGFWLTAATAAGFAALFVAHSAREGGKLPATAVSSALTVPTRGADFSLLTDSARRRNALHDGFSDLKPATYREDGLLLGKSVAANSGGSNAEFFGTAHPENSGFGAGNGAFSPSLAFGRVSVEQRRTEALVYNRDAYAFQPANGFSGVAGYPLSVFSPNVGTASFGDVARHLSKGHMPPPDSVRVEELLNYFSFGHNREMHDTSLAASVEVAAAPWNPAHRLVRIGVTGREVNGATGAVAITVARDLRMQVEFNPEQAQSYRLIGYDEGAVRKSTDVGSIKVVGAQLEAGHVVTALYEVVPVSSGATTTVDGDPLRYGGAEGTLAASDDRKRELLTLKIRYKLPVVEISRKVEIPLIDTGADFALASKDFKFSAAVASFGMLLKESPHKGSTTYDQVLTWAHEGDDKQDKSGHRDEFIDLVKKAKSATVE